jgi:hypothetical protein
MTTVLLRATLFVGSLRVRLTQAPANTYLPHKFWDAWILSQSTYIYIKSTTVYHRVCPLVGIGTLPPLLSPARGPLPPNRGGGGHTRVG